MGSSNLKTFKYEVVIYSELTKRMSTETLFAISEAQAISMANKKYSKNYLIVDVHLFGKEDNKQVIPEPEIMESEPYQTLKLKK